jgi:hypothetical protein
VGNASAFDGFDAGLLSLAFCVKPTQPLGSSLSHALAETIPGTRRREEKIYFPGDVEPG